ncbi:MAG: hypothetical protein MZW92_66375 [Comamonadaceae bacterium]|nr:hypothetical protein [Comamonadaceae bacterium]
MTDPKVGEVTYSSLLLKNRVSRSQGVSDSEGIPPVARTAPSVKREAAITSVMTMAQTGLCDLTGEQALPRRRPT